MQANTHRIVTAREWRLADGGVVPIGTPVGTITCEPVTPETGDGEPLATRVIGPRQIADLWHTSIITTANRSSDARNPQSPANASTRQPRNALHEKRLAEASKGKGRPGGFTDAEYARRIHVESQAYSRRRQRPRLITCTSDDKGLAMYRTDGTMTPITPLLTSSIGPIASYGTPAPRPVSQPLRGRCRNRQHHAP